MFSYPTGIVVTILQEHFGCRIHDAGDPEFLAVSCDGPLRAAVLYVEPFEVLHDSIAFLCAELDIDHAALVELLDAAVNPNNWPAG